VDIASSVKPFDASDPAYVDLDARTAASLLAVSGDIALVIDSAGVVRDIARGTDDSAQIEDGSRQWVGKRWSQTVTVEARMKIDSLLKEAASKGVSKRRQVNHILTDGVDLPMSYTAFRLGKKGDIVAVGRDMRHVSALQQRLVEAQQSMERDYWRMRHVETRYRLLFQMSSDGIFVLDASTMKVLDANTAAGQIFDEAAERLVGRAFPFGVTPTVAQSIGALLDTARSAGRSGDITIAVTGNDRSYHVSASCFRQESATLLLVRLSVAESGSADASADSAARLADLIDRTPDGFVVTDLEGNVLTANRAFLDMAELASQDQVRGKALGNWLGRPGADFPIFSSMLKKNGAVRLIDTVARGSHGSQSEVEVSAVWVPEGEEPCIGFTIRDVGRRLAVAPRGALDLTRAVEELTSLVGRVSLRDLVRDTVDLVERHFIEAALELTNNNRTSAAEVLGVSRQSLYVKLRRHRLEAPGSDRDEETVN